MVEKNGPDTDIKLWMAAMSRDVANTQEELSRVHKTLYGNGKPGLDETVRTLNATIERIETSVTSFEKSVHKTMATTLKWVVFGVLGILVEIGIWAIRQGAVS